MKRPVVAIAFLLLTGAHAKSQTAEDSIKGVIVRMFMAMKNSDPVLLRTCFTDSAIFQTVARDKSGSTVVRRENVAEFITMISTMPRGLADERITYDVLRVDGPLAMVWTPYKFYLEGKFSHCGVNSFQLVRLAEGWRIQYLIDTRRKQPCE